VIKYTEICLCFVDNVTMVPCMCAAELGM